MSFRDEFERASHAMQLKVPPAIRNRPFRGCVLESRAPTGSCNREQTLGNRGGVCRLIASPLPLHRAAKARHYFWAKRIAG